MTQTALPTTAPTPRAPSVRRLWRRELEHYPLRGARRGFLSLTVLVTVSLYWMAFVQGGVATKIVAEYHFTFWQLVLLGVASAVAGALASLTMGLADRFGRANIVVVGMLVCAALVAIALPRAADKQQYFAWYTLLGLVEGALLVASPALMRDFSPQVGRARAMGSWAIGPVVGMLIVTAMASNTLDRHPDWRWQFYVAGAVGAAIGVVALFGLRELSPALRDQLIVSERERALVEARAAGLDTEALLEHHWRSMMRLDILGPALAISLFLFFYTMLIGFLVVYMSTVFGWTEARGNALGNWYWATNAIALLAAGALSDRLRVRKPFLLVGTAMSVVGTSLFALAATHPATDYYAFAWMFVLTAAGGGLAYVGWMAAYTETIERHNPAATATGLGLWGWFLRSMAALAIIGMSLFVPATHQLVDHGPRLQKIVAAYPDQVKMLGTLGSTAVLLGTQPNDPAVQDEALAKLAGLDTGEVTTALQFRAEHQAEIATAQAIAPATAAALAANPTDAAALNAAVAQVSAKLGVSKAEALNRLVALAGADKGSLLYLQQHAGQLAAAGARLKTLSLVPAADLAYLGAHGNDVAAARQDQARQWQRWWWVCVGGQLVLVPAAFLLTGRWSPRRAREDALRHDELVNAEMAALVRDRIPSSRAAADATPATLKE